MSPIVDESMGESGTARVLPGSRPGRGQPSVSAATSGGTPVPQPSSGRLPSDSSSPPVDPVAASVVDEPPPEPDASPSSPSSDEHPTAVRAQAMATATTATARGPRPDLLLARMGDTLARSRVAPRDSRWLYTPRERPTISFMISVVPP